MPEQEVNPRKKRSSVPLIITVIIVAIAAAGGYYAWDTYLRAPAEEAPAPVVDATPPQPTTLTYASTTMRFTLGYPQTFTLQEPYAYTRVSPTKPISGVKFAVPSALTQGTNLAADSGISVEQLPRANLCTADIYLLANVRAVSVTEGAVVYSVATSTEVKSGETFDEVVYAFPSSKPCIAVRYFMHYSAVGSTTRAFDRAAVLGAFDEIRRSITLQAAN